MSGTKDTNWRSYYGPTPDTSDFVNPENPDNYDDIMKFSNCSGAVVINHYVEAGQENCIDAVRGSNYLFEGVTMADAAGVSTVTIKGSIDGWLFSNCVIGRGAKTDIEVGQFDNYWSPSSPPTRNGIIRNCQTRHNRPIRVTCWHADAPTVEDSDVVIRRIPWIIWFPYFCFCWLKCRIW